MNEIDYTKAQNCLRCTQAYDLVSEIVCFKKGPDELIDTKHKITGLLAELRVMCNSQMVSEEEL